MGIKHKQSRTTYRAYTAVLSEIWNEQKPLAKLFHTAGSGHIYDSGTNKIFACNTLVFELLQSLYAVGVESAVQSFLAKHGYEAFLQAAEDIIKTIKDENILQMKKASQFGMSDHFKDIKDILCNTVQSIDLEITQECNLRCVYCIYQHDFTEKRNFAPATMSLDVAQKAIRFLKSHCSKTDLVAVGFYGGEPLLRIGFIKKCVAYAKEILGNQKIQFHLTTNATLVTPEIATFLLENGFSILLSLDGPEHFHDQYRKDKSGNGSYENTIKGIKILSEKYGEIQKGSISLNVVYTPPYSGNKINAIDGFLKGLEWLPDVSVIITYPTEGSIPRSFLSRLNLNQDKDLNQWSLEQYRNGYAKSPQMAKGIVEKKFAKLMQRPVFNEPVDISPLNGCCLPGQRKNFISPDGTIRVCEKISTHAPSIGHVDTGFNFEAIKQVYIDGYAEESIDDCSKCWGLRLCDLCYVSAFGESGDFDLKKKKKFCGFKLQSLERLLQNFVAIMEENPGGLNYLSQYDLK